MATPDTFNNSSREAVQKGENGQEIRNSQIEKLKLWPLLETLPWKSNGQRLEDNRGQVKATCQSEDVARVLERCVGFYSQLPGKDQTNACLYKDFLQDAYYLYVALSKAKIPVTSIETAFVEKAFQQFCRSLAKLLEVENIRVGEDPGRPE